MNQAQKARILANKAHASQTRRDGTTPYIWHVAAVARQMMYLGDEKAQAVAWLHDTLEDTTVTSDDLRSEGFSEEVITAVELLTKKEGEFYSNYIARIKSNGLARKVKIADMLANLSDRPTNKQIRKYAAALLELVEE